MLLFDFDGVMVDSLNEVAVTACNAATGGLATSFAETPKGFDELFRRNRFHIQPAADFPTVARWCLDHRATDPDRLLTRADYAAILARETEPAGRRRDHFFATRRKFVEKDRTAWLDLNAPYYPLWDGLKRLGAEHVVIVTNKNKPAVLELCHHFGLRILAENVYSAEGGASKQDNLILIQKRFRAPPYHFIDDSLPNLRDLQRDFAASPEIHFLFADWGYCGPGEPETAAKEGFPVHCQESFVEFMESDIREAASSS